MRKYRVFVENSLIDLDERVVTIDKSLQRYIEQVLRGAQDCKIVVFDGSGKSISPHTTAKLSLWSLKMWFLIVYKKASPFTVPGCSKRHCNG